MGEGESVGSWQHALLGTEWELCGAEMAAGVEDVGEHRTPSGDAVKAVDRAEPGESS